MPIVDVEVVSLTGELQPADLAARLANALGDAFEVAPGKLWVRIRTLGNDRYAENGQKAPDPVFVTVLAAKPPEGDALRELIGKITQAVADLTHRPASNVHVLFEPAARGRIAFGGQLVD